MKRLLATKLFPSSLVFSLSGLSLNFPLVLLLVLLWWLNFMFLLRKLLLNVRLIKLSLKNKIPYNIVRKSWINFTCFHVVSREAMLKKAVDIKTKSDWLLKFQLKISAKKVEYFQLFFGQLFLLCFLILRNRL